MKQTNHNRPRIQVHGARRDAATAARFGSIGWHTFRHTYRTLLSDADTPLEVQQKLMRHADIRTTTLYGEVPMEKKREANSAVVRNPNSQNGTIAAPKTNWVALGAQFRGVGLGG